MIRELSMSFMSAQGKHSGSETAREWSHIAPETNGATLSALLCPLM